MVRFKGTLYTPYCEINVPLPLDIEEIKVIVTIYIR